MTTINDLPPEIILKIAENYSAAIVLVQCNRYFNTLISTDKIYYNHKLYRATTLLGIIYIAFEIMSARGFGFINENISIDMHYNIHTKKMYFSPIIDQDELVRTHFGMILDIESINNNLSKTPDAQQILLDKMCKYIIVRSQINIESLDEYNKNLLCSDFNLFIHDFVTLNDNDNDTPSFLYTHWQFFTGLGIGVLISRLILSYLIE